MHSYSNRMHAWFGGSAKKQLIILHINYFGVGLYQNWVSMYALYLPQVK